MIVLNVRKVSYDAKSKKSGNLRTMYDFLLSKVLKLQVWFPDRSPFRSIFTQKSLRPIRSPWVIRS
jgi:hypothetical protein